MKELAGELRRDYAHKAPLVVGILRGSFVFMADLVRHLDFPLTLDFMGRLLLSRGPELREG